MVLNSCWKCCAYVAEEFGTIRSEEVVRTNLIGYARFRKYQIGKSDCLYKFPNIKSDNLILSDLIWYQYHKDINAIFNYASKRYSGYWNVRFKQSTSLISSVSSLHPGQYVLSLTNVLLYQELDWSTGETMGEKKW